MTALDVPGTAHGEPNAPPDITTVVHDLNNVLTVILGGLALTERRLAGDATMTRLIDNMRQAAERGSLLVRDLMVASGSTPLFADVALAAGTQNAPSQASRKRRILVVEDDPDVAEVAVAVLEGLGHQVELAGTAPAALTQLENFAYDLVFSDIVMPGGMTGVELAETMRDSYPRIPVLLATGYSAAAVGPAARRFPLMAKPYSVRELASRVAQLLDDPVAP